VHARDHIARIVSDYRASRANALGGTVVRVDLGIVKPVCDCPFVQAVLITEVFGAVGTALVDDDFAGRVGAVAPLDL
jgi:hypothetical protein